MGRVWGQNMLLEVRDANLLLTDIESKVNMRPADLDLHVQRAHRIPTAKQSDTDSPPRPIIVNFQEFTTKEMILKEAWKKGSIQLSGKSIYFDHDYATEVIQKRKQYQKIKKALKEKGIRFQTPYTSIRIHWEDGPRVYRTAHEAGRELRKRGFEVEEPAENTPDDAEVRLQKLLGWQRRGERSSREHATSTADILNHIFADIEIFMGQVAAAEAKNTKKKKKKKKGKDMGGMPSTEEFATCLHKIKCGFNLLGELKGQISNPSAADFVHSLFSTLAFVVPHCPESLPSNIIAPLLTPHAIRLMSEEATTEEDELWQSLGDPWNIPSTQWPEDDEDIPTYTLEFSDGWHPPEVTEEPESGEPVRRQASVRRQENQPPAPNQGSMWTSPHSPQQTRPGERKQMRVKHDFTARNMRELTVRKGEMVELLDMSKQWWKVRNNRREEGFIPNNILESDEDKHDQDLDVPPVLTKGSKPPQVKAWLEDKGFSKITVRCLGGLSGSMLLGMTRQELKSVCPEEGGRVFYQLQLVKSALAVASLERSA